MAACHGYDKWAEKCGGVLTEQVRVWCVTAVLLVIARKAHGSV